MATVFRAQASNAVGRAVGVQRIDFRWIVIIIDISYRGKPELLDLAEVA